MPRVGLCLVIIACVALLACGASDEGGSLDGSGYSLEIADGWGDTTEEAPSVEDLGLDDPALAAVTVDATVTGDESDGFAPNVSVVTTPAPRKSSALKLAEANLETSRAQGNLPPGAGGGALDLSESDVEETELGGEPAASYEQLAQAPPGEVRQLQVYAVVGGTAYAITYSGLDDGQYEENLPDVEQMLDSWTWD